MKLNFSCRIGRLYDTPFCDNLYPLQSGRQLDLQLQILLPNRDSKNILVNNTLMVNYAGTVRLRIITKQITYRLMTYFMIVPNSSEKKINTKNNKNKNLKLPFLRKHHLSYPNRTYLQQSSSHLQCTFSRRSHQYELNDHLTLTVRISGEVLVQMYVIHTNKQSLIQSKNIHKEMFTIVNLAHKNSWYTQSEENIY